MDTISRGEWSRASFELCRAATRVSMTGQHVHLYDDLNDDDEAALHHLEVDVEEPRDEEAPLIVADRPSSPSSIATYGTNIDKQLQHGTKRRESITVVVWDEARSMLTLAIPVIGTYLLEMLPGLVSIILVGHVHSDLTKQYIDACALAVMYMNLTGLSVGFGLASAMDTLCSQAYGAGQVYKMGVYMQTGLVVLSAAFVVVFGLNYHAGTILIFLGQPTDIARLAGTFTLYLLPGIPFLFLYELLRKVLQAQNIALPMFYVAIAANLVNVGLGYCLVYYTSFGWIGAAVARTACNVSFCLFMILYLHFSGIVQTFWGSGWHLKAALSGIPQFVSLGIPGALQLCFEWWAFECLALIAGMLPNAVLAIGANAILLNVSSMVYMLYLGVSIATNVRIGNALGAGQPRRAKMASRLAIALALCCSVLCATFLIAFRTSLPVLFTHDPDIGAYTSELLYIAAVLQLPDSVNGAVQGIFRGSGRQSLGATLNFVAYYVVGIPSGVWLAFHYDQGVKGLWIGMTLGLSTVGATGAFIISKSNWNALTEDAIQRLKD